MLNCKSMVAYTTAATHSHVMMIAQFADMVQTKGEYNLNLMVFNRPVCAGVF